MTSLDFDDTGEFLVAACDDDSLQLYNAKEGKHVKELMSKKYGAHLARFTHGSQSLLYASTKYDETIRYLSTHDFQYLRYFKGHTGPVTALALNPGSDSFLSCSLDNTVRLWNLSSPSPQARLNLSTPHLAAYDPSATVIAIASSSTSSILLYDLRNYDKAPFSTFDLRHLSPPATTHSPTWTKLEFSNDGKSLLLATSAPSGHILLDAFKGDLKAYCTYPNAKTPFVAARAAPGSSLSSQQQQQPLGQGDVCFSADGRYLIGGSGGDHDAVVWDTQGIVPAAEDDEQQQQQQKKILKPTASLPCKGRVAVAEWNPRFNMLATGDHDVVFWLPDEYVGVRDLGSRE